MKLCVPDYYKNFKCIDKDCTDSCCAGWEVDVDDDSFAYYKTVGGAFGKRLHSVMSEEGEKHFILQDGNCPFLNKGGLCDLFTELGEDKLCTTCTMYPRFVEEYGSCREMGIAFSCKTAAKLILESDRKAGFVTEEDNQPITTYNDINPELYFALVHARRTAYGLVQNRAYSIRERMQLLLKFAGKVQRAMKKKDYAKIQLLSEKYAQDTAFLDGKLLKLHKKYESEEQKAAGSKSAAFLYLPGILKHYLKFEVIKEAFPVMIADTLEQFRLEEEYYQQRDSFEAFYADRRYEYEHMLVYYIFRYFLKAVYDGELLDKVKMAVVSTTLVEEFDRRSWQKNGGVFTLTEQIEITHLYSREVEHSEENFEELFQLFHKNKMFAEDRIMEILIR